MSNYNDAMIKKNAVALISRLKENSDRLILSELEKHGVKGIAPSHGGILVALYEKQKVTMKELAERIKRTKPTVTVLVNKLVDSGYIKKEKDPQDNRVTYISLTEKGKDLEQIFYQVSSTLNDVIYGDLTEEEQEQLEHILTNRLNRFR
ncbi:MarR family winged helix-turn-helix transcriptional regulator [Ectobacillus polymachus]|uniref:MarR family winged helix-turn-helix transcriptional regulator n=1 Tax=Ectobacillus polymachus TaxID=1508806 RepID=UPI003A86A7A1